ncbi:site-specific integrase [Mucilaginibacter sp.]|jgi:site-specific recombinase XerD|uniref:site-specific integrase n=1 Tax=Mucilaginibacter sp. TaxID=1882438 RepID=UPI002BDA00B3|nr:site-specific integrase [Mucilaginibacter sp.]HTI60383.1 site-specific integrase [Mucilaginibacter sp.]
MRLTYSIKTVLRPDKIKADGMVPIYYSVRVGPSTTRIPTGKTILLKDWNKASSSPKLNCKLNELLNSYLSAEMTKWRVFMMSRESLSQAITFTIATSYFDQNAKLTFFTFWEQQLDLWNNSKRDNTLKSYRSALKMLKSFNGKLNFGDLTYDTVQKLDLYMANVKGNAVGGRFVKHKCLKAMCNEAIKKGYLTKNPYIHFKIKASTGKRNFLSISEVRQLMNLDVPAEEVFQHKTKDLFLFSCFTGLRYSDVMNLKWEDIKNDPYTITLKMTKTSKQITIPLTANSKAIIEKYGKHIIKSPQTKVFPQIANQVLNRNIKDIMKNAGINKDISYHCSRHTFASNLIEANTNILFIKDLMGHSRITETQVYAKALEADLVNSINNMSDIYNFSHAI